MRICLDEHGTHRLELIDQFETYSAEALSFHFEDDATAFLAGFRSDPEFVAGLRGILLQSSVVSDAWRRTEREVVEEVSRLLVSGKLHLVRSEIPRIQFASIGDRVAPAPLPPAQTRPAPKEPAPEPVAKCTNPVCQPAFAEAAASGSAFVTRSAPG